jgi:thiamine biosynthesis lipoprotein
MAVTQLWVVKGVCHRLFVAQTDAATRRRVRKKKVEQVKKLLTKTNAVLLVIVITVILLSVIVISNRPQYIAVNSHTFMTMGTFAQVQLRCDNQETAQLAQARVIKVLQDIDKMMSTYREDSELSKVNQEAARQPVKVSRETFLLLQKAQHYSRISDGAFDITVTPLIQMWDQAKEDNSWPNRQQMMEVLEKVGYEKLVLTNDEKLEVSFTYDGVQLNVNAIAKGYVVDRALDAVRMPGVMAALVDIGGEIACFGQDRPGKDWVIGVQDPFADDLDNPLSQKSYCLLKVSNMSVATSGDYRRYIELEGHRLSHIIDPRTGFSANKLPSVTVIAPKAIDADALATSVPDTEALLIAGTHEAPQEYRSSGFYQYEIQDD